MRIYFIYFSSTINVETNYFLGRLVSHNIPPSWKVQLHLTPLQHVSHHRNIWLVRAYFVFLFVTRVSPNTFVKHLCNMQKICTNSPYYVLTSIFKPCFLHSLCQIAWELHSKGTDTLQIFSDYILWRRSVLLIHILLLLKTQILY